MCHNVPLQWKTVASSVRSLLVFPVFLFENDVLLFLSGKTTAHHWCEIVWQIASGRRTQRLNTTETKHLVKCTAGNRAGVKFSEIHRRGHKTENQTICTQYVAELANVIKSEQSGEGHTTYMCRNCFRLNKHIYSCMAFVFNEPQCRKNLFSR